MRSWCVTGPHDAERRERCWLWRREGANQSEKEGERWVTGTEIGVVGIWIVRGNDGEKSGSSATLGVVSALVRVVTRSCPCVVGRGFLNGKKLASF